MIPRSPVGKAHFPVMCNYTCRSWQIRQQWQSRRRRARRAHRWFGGGDFVGDHRCDANSRLLHIPEVLQRSTFRRCL